MNRAEHGGIIFRFLGLLFFLAILAVLYTFRYPVMRFAGEMWVISDAPVASDAIVVLGDDNYSGDRAAHAAELYRQGVAREVVASGRMLRPQSGMADLMAQDLQRDGVPASSISKISYQTDAILAQADSLRSFATGEGWRRILVVTSNYDTRRAKFVFQREFPGNVAVNVSAAADQDFIPTQWWQTSAGQKMFFTALASYTAARFQEMGR